MDLERRGLIVVIPQEPMKDQRRQWKKIDTEIKAMTREREHRTSVYQPIKREGMIR
jgi:hypothetical protein